MNESWLSTLQGAFSGRQVLACDLLTKDPILDVKTAFRVLANINHNRSLDEIVNLFSATAGVIPRNELGKAEAPTLAVPSSILPSHFRFPISCCQKGYQ